MSTTTNTTTTPLDEEKSWTPFATLRRRARGRASHVAACEAFARGDYATAVERFGDALDVDDANQFALCNRALAWMRCGNFVDAVADAEACVRRAPEWHKAWFRLGQAREGVGRDAEALSAYLECRRCDARGVDEKECDEAIAALRERVERGESETTEEEVREMEAKRDVDAREEDAERDRRREKRIEKWEAKRAKRKDAEERLKQSLGVEGEDVRVADVHTYVDDFEDSDDSALEAYDGAGRAKFIERKITDFVSITRRSHTHVGAKATVDTMFEMRRYGNCQISLNAKLEATAKFKASADAMDECRLPYVVIPVWREASSPWPMPLARSHQDVQDSMWLLENVARTMAMAMYEHVGKSADDLHRSLDSPLFEVNGESGPRAEDVSPSALVLSDDESFVSAYGERTNALVRVDWLEAYEEEDDAADDGATLLQVTICRELAERLDGNFITTEELDPSERDGQGPNGESYACPRAKRPAERTLASFFLCPVQK